MSKIAYGGKLLTEFLRFAKQNKVYWAVPLIVLLMLVMLAVVGGQGTAPFIYIFW